MGAVLIHSGMPKTGSTSIQAWLRDVASDLARDRGVQVVVDGFGPDGRTLLVEPYGAGPIVASTAFALAMAGAVNRPDERELQERVVGQLVDQLDAAARRHGTVLVTSEALHGLLVPPTEALLAGLEDLARRHAVRVVYYVRPQDTALEARWRQWGFHQPVPPSEWVRAEVDALRYAEALAALEARAPSIAFEPRPYRADLLAGATSLPTSRAGSGPHPPPSHRT